jgi:dihydroorotate dehydrogenase (NAD+) catalytic subunit
MGNERLSTTLCGIRLKNPVLAASGAFGYGVEFEKIVDLNALGGIVVKGVSREPISGNPSPRLWHTAGGMMNSVGLQNVGVQAFVRDKLPKLRRYSVPVFANVFGNAIDDYVEVIRRLEEADGLAAYELNVSCPNTKEGGIFFSSDPGLMGELIARVRLVCRRPLIVKLSPNVARIEPFAKTAEVAGADAISLINTVVSYALNASDGKPRIAAGFAGLSGPAIKPLALRLVKEAANTVHIPVIGIGGIATGEDVAEFLIAGASAVQVGTATFIDPRAPLLVARQLNRFLEKSRIAHVRDLVPQAEKVAEPVTEATLPRAQ